MSELSSEFSRTSRQNNCRDVWLPELLAVTNTLGSQASTGRHWSMCSGFPDLTIDGLSSDDSSPAASTAFNIGATAHDTNFSPPSVADTRTETRLISATSDAMLPSDDTKADDKQEEKLLAEFYPAIKKGAYETAKKAGKELLELQKHKYGKNSKEVTLTLYLLGRVYEADRDYKAARESFTEGVETAQKAFSKPDNVMTALLLCARGRTKALLGDLNASAEDYSKALPMYEADSEKLQAPDFAPLIEGYQEYAVVLEALGRKDEAAKQRKRANELQDKIEKKQ